MRKLRFLLKKGKFIFASLLILFLFVSASFSVGATSLYSPDYTEDTAFGVPFTFELNFEAPAYNDNSFIYTFSPIVTEDINLFNSGLVACGGYDVSSYTYDFDVINGTNTYIYNPIFYLGDSDFNPYEVYNLTDLTYNNNGHFVGSFSCDNNVIFSSPSFFEVYDLDFKIKAQDFSCWIDEDGKSGTELFFYVNTLLNYLSLDSVVVSYSEYGSGDTVYTVTLTDFVDERGFLRITPYELGYDLWNKYIYIHDLELNCSSYDDPFYFFESDYEFSFYSIYTLNPALYDYSYGCAGGIIDINPALPLLDYTEWMGAAVSGLLDLEIFPHFTLGGILMTLLSFVCVTWFLKLVAGG